MSTNLTIVSFSKRNFTSSMQSRCQKINSRDADSMSHMEEIEESIKSSADKIKVVRVVQSIEL